MAYKEIKTIKEGFKALTSKNKDGILIGEKLSIKSRWAEHFKLLLNPKHSGQNLVDTSRKYVTTARNEEPVKSPTKEE
jgi:hypothetical protein